jgi:hypothetical protein
MSDDDGDGDVRAFFIYYGREEEVIQRDVTHVKVHPSVKVIKAWAFANCHQLTTAFSLNDGLEVIEKDAFYRCYLLQGIVIPNTLKTIKARTFSYCMHMATITLGEGLDEIGDNAFSKCGSLERIVIPPAVEDIYDRAFCKCQRLTTMVFSDETEEFVSCKAMREWWNHGVHVKCLSVYCLLVKFNIPEHLGLVLIRIWQDIIYDMMKRIPTISMANSDD